MYTYHVSLVNSRFLYESTIKLSQLSVYTYEVCLGSHFSLYAVQETTPKIEAIAHVYFQSPSYQLVLFVLVWDYFDSWRIYPCIGTELAQ
jgi:hypothetical protein